MPNSPTTNPDATTPNGEAAPQGGSTGAPPQL
jgi:hypothetical protein